VPLLTLRRYVKDFLLNVGKSDKQTEYLKKFDETAMELQTIVKRISSLIANDQHLLKDNEAIKAKDDFASNLESYLAGV